MLLTQNWLDILKQAQEGELQPAHAAHAAEAGGQLLGDYFYARCLTEAPALEHDQYPRAVELLKPLVEAEPLNPLYLQTLILALARSATPDASRRAAQLWRRYGLPHDLDLLGQTALMLETALRPFPAHSPLVDRPWPACLKAENEGGSDNLSPPLVSSSTGGAVQGRPTPEKVFQRLMRMMEKHEGVQIIEQIEGLMENGEESADLHLLAGVALEEEGEPTRARAHLARAMRLESRGLFTRSALARVYWRLNWLDLALPLARSLPVEGPEDYGRHYLLALIHEARGDRKGAVTAMRRCLVNFFEEARHGSIRRALERWLKAHPE